LDDSYDIPYRCLIPRDFHGLLIAGRAISATHEAHGSLRTQGGVMAIGQAAGTAAGLCALKTIEPRAIDVVDLQNYLLREGASLHRNVEDVQRQQQTACKAVEKALLEKRITGLHMRKS
jgi:hypothetical protein